MMPPIFYKQLNKARRKRRNQREVIINQQWPSVHLYQVDQPAFDADQLAIEARGCQVIGNHAFNGCSDENGNWAARIVFLQNTPWGEREADLPGKVYLHQAFVVSQFGFLILLLKPRRFDSWFLGDLHRL